jgi:hypothetical protein
LVPLGPLEGHFHDLSAMAKNLELRPTGWSPAAPSAAVAANEVASSAVGKPAVAFLDGRASSVEQQVVNASSGRHFDKVHSDKRYSGYRDLDRT